MHAIKSMKKYTCIAKTGDDKFVKYRLNDLLKFTCFLDKQWPGWRWYNVFDNRYEDSSCKFHENKATGRFKNLMMDGTKKMIS
jgi:hypothetical protein